MAKEIVDYLERTALHMEKPKAGCVKIGKPGCLVGSSGEPVVVIVDTNHKYELIPPKGNGDEWIAVLPKLFESPKQSYLLPYGRDKLFPPLLDEFRPYLALPTAPPLVVRPISDTRICVATPDGALPTQVNVSNLQQFVQFENSQSTHTIVEKETNKSVEGQRYAKSHLGDAVALFSPTPGYGLSTKEKSPDTTSLAHKLASYCQTLMWPETYWPDKLRRSGQYIVSLAKIAGFLQRYVRLTTGKDMQPSFAYCRFVGEQMIYVNTTSDIGVQVDRPSIGPKELGRATLPQVVEIGDGVVKMFDLTQGNNGNVVTITAQPRGAS